MKNIQLVKIEIVEAHLEKLGSGLRFDITNYSYGLEKLTKNEWKCYKALIEKSDEDRIKMAGNFDHITNNNGKLSDLIELEEILKETHDDRGKRMKKIIDGDDKHEKGLDLLKDEGFEIVFIGADVLSYPLFMMDGTHKMIAHFLTHEKSLEGVPCYLCIHPNIRSWSWFPKP